MSNTLIVECRCGNKLCEVGGPYMASDCVIVPPCPRCARQKRTTEEQLTKRQQARLAIVAAVYSNPAVIYAGITKEDYMTNMTAAFDTADSLLDEA